MHENSANASGDLVVLSFSSVPELGTIRACGRGVAANEVASMMTRFQCHPRARAGATVLDDLEGRDSEKACGQIYSTARKEASAKRKRGSR